MGRSYGYWKLWDIIGYMGYDIWIGIGIDGMILEVDINIDIGFDEFIEFWGLSYKGFIWFYLIDIRILIRISGDISKFIISLLIIILHILIYIKRTFKYIRSRI